MGFDIKTYLDIKRGLVDSKLGSLLADGGGHTTRLLESAMIAHFCADFVIYVVGPAFLKIG